MTEAEKAARLERAHDAAITHMAEPWHDHYAYPTFAECLKGLSALPDGENWEASMRAVGRTPPIGFDKARAAIESEYQRAKVAVAILLSALFQNEHELTDEEFASDHWQTLFVLTYPEARA